ncbi:MAG: 3D domain-containing protein [Proteobacteria bacterium]|nr:3D domain-containing protein [Pseudomonadota bacterium]
MLLAVFAVSCTNEDDVGEVAVAEQAIEVSKKSPVALGETSPASDSIELNDTVDKAETMPPEQAAPQPLGNFQFTYYWIARQQKDIKPEVQLYTSDCKPLAKVSKKFARQLSREGTGKLRDGRVINVSGSCDCEHSPCYFVPNRRKRWGVGVGKRALSPFRSVAVDPATVSIGTLLYVPELDGLTMPGRQPWGGFVHDGCVIADDRGGNVQGKQLDFFAVKKSHYHALYRRHRLTQVTVFEGSSRCQQVGKKLIPVNRNSI